MDQEWMAARRDALLVLVAHIGLLGWAWERSVGLMLLAAVAAALLAAVAAELTGPAAARRSAALLFALALMAPALLAGHGALRLTGQAALALLVGAIVAAWLLWLFFWLNREAHHERMG